MRQGVVFGSNTSTLPITSLAGEFNDPTPLHRHPFLLAGREDDAGRDHPRQADRRRGARDRARLRAGDPQDADRGQRLARLLHLARGRHLSARGPPDAGRGHPAGDDRECRPHGRHAGRPARAQRRGRGRSRLEDPQGDRDGLAPAGGRSAPEGAAGRDGREARPARAQERQGLLRLSREGPEEAVARARRAAADSGSIPTRSTSPR